jgi:hypothetical protein
MSFGQVTLRQSEKATLINAGTFHEIWKTKNYIAKAKFVVCAAR